MIIRLFAKNAQQIFKDIQLTISNLIRKPPLFVGVIGILTKYLLSLQRKSYGKMQNFMRNKIFLVALTVVLLSLGWLRVTGLTLVVALVPLLWISEGYDASRCS